MELVYSMRRKPLKCEPPYFESTLDRDVVKPICTISVANIIAFSSPSELSDSDGDTWAGHVYVCDMDTPWDSHKVTSTVHPVSALEWDCEGKQLLVCTTVGQVMVYKQKEFLINEWALAYSAEFPGEHIIKSTFFHNGRTVVSVEKKPDAPITERFQVLRSAPTLKGFGGTPVPGVCVITGTGLVCCVSRQPSTSASPPISTPPAPAAPAPLATCVSADCLRSARERVVDAAFAHKNGNILVAAVCITGTRGLVRCGSISVSRGTRDTVTVSPLPALPLTSIPTCTAWSLRAGGDYLYIAGSTLTLCKLAERAHPVHKLLCKGPGQGNTTPGGGAKPGSDCFNTLSWSQSGAWSLDGPATSVSALASVIPRCVVASAAAITLVQGSEICSHQLVPCSTPDVPAAGTPPKKPYGQGALPSGSPTATVSCVSSSASGSVVAVLDSHSQLHLYRRAADSPTGMLVAQTVRQLERGMVTGYDCLDALLTLKQNVLEAVYERLTDSFLRQPASFQQYYFHACLKMRMAVCRQLESGQTSVSWLCTLQSALALCAAAHTTDKLDDELEKGQLSAESKAELEASLAPLQTVLPRAAAAALTALAAAAPPSYDIPPEPGALSALRRALSLCALSPARAALEPLARALSRLAAPPHKPDFGEECLALTTQMPARIWESLPRCSVSAPHGKPTPYYLEYGVEPEALRYNPEPPPYAQSDTTPTFAMDSIRYTYLGGGADSNGGGPSRARRCARCGARALAAGRRHQRAWDDRFLPACRCGGKWSLYSNI